MKVCLQHIGLRVSLGDIVTLGLDDESPVWPMLCLVVVGEERNGKDYGLFSKAGRNGRVGVQGDSGKKTEVADRG